MNKNIIQGSPTKTFFIEMITRDISIKDAINNRPPMQTIEVEIGELIDPKDRSISLQENYEKQFNL